MGSEMCIRDSHDSIGLGEDGPTHQPVEQITALRSTPNLHTWRPCDTVESAVCWKSAIERKDGPSALIFSRQGLAPMPRNEEQLGHVAKGGYTLIDCDGEPDLIFIATGSEVELATKAAAELSAQGHKIRVVSMPCAELFSAQDALYKQSVLPIEVGARIAIEAAHEDFWYKFVGLDGRIIGMSTFGESAPGNVLMEHFGFTLENVLATAEDLLAE